VEAEELETLETPPSTDPTVKAAETKMAATLKPTKPTMGDVAQIGVDKWAAWTGGKPKLDWSGFKTATADFETPNQMRPIYDVKGYNHRKTGLTNKFKETDTLIPFKKRVWTHLKDNGLDTITYLPDMRKEMSCVIYDHSRYTLDSARTASLKQVKSYDKYDVTNNTAAIAFLLDSLSPALAETISKKLEETDSIRGRSLPSGESIPGPF
jgi:hypothetical protein